MESNNIKTKVYSVKASSHIITLLGDELIGSNSLALFELVKNSYDADADNVEAGPLRVRQLGLKYCRINIVSTTKDQKYGRAQREIERGLYVLTHSNTKDKKKMLDRISNALHLGWTVEIIDK